MSILANPCGEDPVSHRLVAAVRSLGASSTAPPGVPGACWLPLVALGPPGVGADLGGSWAAAHLCCERLPGCQEVKGHPEGICQVVETNEAGRGIVAPFPTLVGGEWNGRSGDEVSLPPSAALSQNTEPLCKIGNAPIFGVTRGFRHGGSVPEMGSREIKKSQLLFLNHWRSLSSKANKMPTTETAQTKAAERLVSEPLCFEVNTVSHVFELSTGAELTTAIRADQQTPAQAAKDGRHV